jgi:hypothetical protein
VREVAGSGENHPSLAPAASRRAVLIPVNNLWSAASSSLLSFKHPLDATLAITPFANFYQGL